MRLNDRKEVTVVERDVIGHLIDVERQAADLTLEANAEAERRKKAAREKADAELRLASASIAEELDRSFEASRVACDEAIRREFESFAERLAAMPQDTAAFAACLDEYFSR
jgi:vacuolar-type H+-ATPase subunit H